MDLKIPKDRHKKIQLDLVSEILGDFYFKGWLFFLNNRTGTDQNTWAMHASTLIKHITENPSRICDPVRSADIKK